MELISIIYFELDKNHLSCSLKKFNCVISETDPNITINAATADV